MGMTISEKILATASGRDAVQAGEVVWAEPRTVMAHDISGVGASLYLKEQFGDEARVKYPDRIVLVEDHYVPCRDKTAANNLGVLERFAEEQGIHRYHRWGVGGNYGICHVLLPYEGYVLPGTLVVGGDSHSCTHGAMGAFATGCGEIDIGNVMYTGDLWFRVPETLQLQLDGVPDDMAMAKDVILHVVGRMGSSGALYKTTEFAGSYVTGLGIDERLTLTNMAVEMGAKTGLIAADATTEAFVKARTDAPFEAVQNDEDATLDVIHLDIDGLAPMVAQPHSPDNVVAVSEVEGVPLDQAVICACTGAKYTDLEAAAAVLAGRTVRIRTVVLPATQAIYRRALRDGVLETLTDAGATVGPPTCGPCLGGNMGVLGDGRVCISTSNRNFIGRMGSKQSRTYLASPRTVAASAVNGRICDPRAL
jgi:3-isopropylmalate/(R)-2-methylmalate dehydratase large subunit